MAGLRIVCEGDARNSTVLINGRPVGNCPMDIEIALGNVDLQVSRTDSNGNNRIYRETFSLSSGVLRRVDVQASAMQAVSNRTKEETIEWIESKLKQEMEGSYQGLKFLVPNVSAKIDRGLLRLSWRIQHPDHSSPELFSLSIEINKVDKIEATSFGDNSSPGITFAYMSNCVGCLISTPPTSFHKGRKIPIYFDVPIRGSEAGLVARLNNAFRHLKTFYPPPTKRKPEAF